MIRRPGGILKRDRGLHEHVGVAWFGGRVWHDGPRHGERLSRIDEFAAGRPLCMPPTPADRRARVLANGVRVPGAPRRSHLGCDDGEPTAHFVVHGRASSPQLLTWTLVALVGAFVVLR